MKKKKNKIKLISVNVALTFMLVIAVAALGLISWYCLSGTFFIRGYMELESVYQSDSPAGQTAAFGLFVFAVCVLSFFTGKTGRYSESISRYVLYAVSVCILLAGFFYIGEHPYMMDGDQINTFYAGVYARFEGQDIQYAMFGPGGYISIYPQQKGLAFFYYLLYPLFKEDMFICLQFLHLIYPQMILYCGYNILKTEGVSPASRIVYCFAIPACVPLTLYLPYMYGDLGSVAFSFLAVLFLVRYIKRSRKADAVLLCFSAAVSFLLRKQIWIFLIAALIALLVQAVKALKVRFLVTGLCMVLAAGLSFAAIDRFFEVKSGYESGKGVPSVCWLVMGLQETNGCPGIYNRYNQGIYEENGFDSEAAEEAAQKDLRERIDAFRSDGVYARCFFAAKIRQEWTAPDCEALSTTGVWDNRSGRDADNPPGWLTDLYNGARYGRLMRISNAYQSVVFLSAFIMALLLLFKKKKEIPVTLILAYTYLIGGFVFFTFWENKSRYILPFFVFTLLCLPFFAGEIVRILTKAENCFKNRFRNPR